MTSGCAALLRGVNVGGHRRMKMERLQEVCGEIGFGDVETYIQSGNVVFTAEEEADDLERLLEDAIAEEWGYDVPVFVRSREEFRGVVDRAPFPELGLGGDEKLYVSFLSGSPSAEAQESFEAAGDERESYFASEREAYVVVRPGDERRRFSNNWVEKTLGVDATTRNWGVVNDLLGLLEDR